jgi:hypothetical protein
MLTFSGKASTPPRSWNLASACRYAASGDQLGKPACLAARRTQIARGAQQERPCLGPSGLGCSNTEAIERVEVR